jgi:hypothetical protein
MFWLQVNEHLASQVDAGNPDTSSAISQVRNYPPRLLPPTEAQVAIHVALAVKDSPDVYHDI